MNQMKDFQLNEINIGDRIAYVHLNFGTPSLRTGKVVGFTKGGSVTIEKAAYSGYGRRTTHKMASLTIVI